MRRKKKRTSQASRYRINQQIRAKQVRVIDHEGKQVGVMSVSEAIRLADRQGLDVVEIAPKAQPPVVKLIDYHKFLYQENKKKQAQQRKAKSGQIKEIRLTPFMAAGDLETRIKKISEFLQERNQVRITVRFKGRQMSNKQAGYLLLEKVTKALEKQAKVDQLPKFVGRQLIMTVSPL